MMTSWLTVAQLGQIVAREEKILNGDALLTREELKGLIGMALARAAGEARDARSPDSAEVGNG
jgi:hypothetical protein